MSKDLCRLCRKPFNDHLITDDGDFCHGKGVSRDQMFMPSKLTERKINVRGKEITEIFHNQAIQVEADGHLCLREDVPADGAEYLVEHDTCTLQRRVYRQQLIAMTTRDVLGKETHHVWRMFVRDPNFKD
jgi:hypothetical protein